MDTIRKNKTQNLIAGLAIMLISGILYMWSVFQPYVMVHFGWSSGQVGMTSSLMIAFFVIGNVLAGLVQEKYRPRNIVLVGGVMFALGMLLTSFLSDRHPAMLYLTYSLISGLGCGFAYCTVLYALQKWYAARAGFITGLTVCFFGLSVVLLAPAARDALAPRRSGHVPHPLGDLHRRDAHRGSLRLAAERGILHGRGVEGPQ
mgnify:CR=1 FL=1